MSLISLIDQLVPKFVSKYGSLPFSFVVHVTGKNSIPIGNEAPAFEVHVRNQIGLSAMKSLNQLKIAEAYIEGHIDIEGDLIKAIMFQNLLSDKNTWLKVWRRLKPLLLGRTKCNPDWIAKHYDSNNLQLLAADVDYNTYTPGNYETDDESLEIGAERKLKFAFDSLNLKPNHSVLDIGSGWGGFLRYAARREIRVTGITLSHHQKQYVENLIKENNFDAQVLYQDCFTWKPPKKYDGITMIHNDRRNYYLWSKKLNERWEEKKAEVVKQSSEQLWRIFRILFAGTASRMNIPSHYATAYRVVLEYPADFVHGMG